MVEDTGLLKRIPFFGGLSAREIKRINMIIERAAFRAGEDIVEEGTPCDAFFIVKSGLARVKKGSRKIIDLGPGEPIGEISFIDQGDRSATVTAIENTVLIKIPSRAFLKLMSAEPEIASKVYRTVAVTLCSRLRETNKILYLIQG